MPRSKKAFYPLLLLLSILAFASVRFFLQKHPFFNPLGILEVFWWNFLLFFICHKRTKANSLDNHRWLVWRKKTDWFKFIKKTQTPIFACVDVFGFRILLELKKTGQQKKSEAWAGTKFQSELNSWRKGRGAFIWNTYLTSEWIFFHPQVDWGGEGAFRKWAPRLWI